MLSLRGLHASYGPVRALEDISLEVMAGQIVTLLGANGAGKTTTLNCISGQVSVTKGSVIFEGEDLTNATPERVVSRGIVQVPEGREIFPKMTVADNLLLGGWLQKDRKQRARDLDRIYELFPRLHERMNQVAGTLSGGEQQMLMIGRALMARPKLIMLDEPSLGLSPILVDQVFATIRRIHTDGLAILLVEQNTSAALNVSSFGYILENGEIAYKGTSKYLKESAHVREAYLGG
jgi:branched-chain amino acid transport system ATP-binding protein